MSTINFSYDPEWLDTLSAPFMTNAFIAGLCIALAAGVMGYFTIARRSTFAAHALAHIGLPGATGAVLLGLPVSLGMGVFALGGALVIGALGKRVSEREIATGTVLAFATGLGLFFAASPCSTYCCWHCWPSSTARCCSARWMSRWHRPRVCRSG